MQESNALDYLEASVYDLAEQVVKLNDTVAELVAAIERATKVAIANG